MDGSIVNGPVPITCKEGGEVVVLSMLLLSIVPIPGLVEDAIIFGPFAGLPAVESLHKVKKL